MSDETTQPRGAIEPFRGTINVQFFDAIIASSENAKMLRGEADEPAYFIPVEDIYFEFLTKTNTTSQHSTFGTASHYRVSAGGEGADNFLLVYDTPEVDGQAIAHHGTFDPAVASIGAVAEQGELHTPDVKDMLTEDRSA